MSPNCRLVMRAEQKQKVHNRALDAARAEKIAIVGAGQRLTTLELQLIHVATKAAIDQFEIDHG